MNNMYRKYFVAQKKKFDRLKNTCEENNWPIDSDWKEDKDSSTQSFVKYIESLVDAMPGNAREMMRDLNGLLTVKIFLINDVAGMVKGNIKLSSTRNVKPDMDNYQHKCKKMGLSDANRIMIDADSTKDKNSNNEAKKINHTNSGRDGTLADDVGSVSRIQINQAQKETNFDYARPFCVCGFCTEFSEQNGKPVCPSLRIDEESVFFSEPVDDDVYDKARQAIFDHSHTFSAFQTAMDLQRLFTQQYKPLPSKREEEVDFCKKYEHLLGDNLHLYQDLMRRNRRSNNNNNNNNNKRTKKDPKSTLPIDRNPQRAAVFDDLLDDIRKHT